MRFEVQPLKFTFRAEEPVRFGRVAANSFRGALGWVLEADIFRARLHDVPSGFKDPPRPFVFRTRHLDSTSVPAGDTFTVQINLFAIRDEVRDRIVEAFGKLDRRSSRLVQVECCERVSVDLCTAKQSQPMVQVALLTPTELKGAENWGTNPDFATLACRLRDRVSVLSSFYGDGLLSMDFKEFAEQSRSVKLVRAALRSKDLERRSSRTGQVHSIGGVVGEIEYSGDLGPFLGFFEAACWTGVGRHTTWGNGELAVKPFFAERSQGQAG